LPIFAAEKKKKDQDMVTLLFILIAYAIRKRYLPEDATRGDKVLYYVFSVVATPLFGPWFFRKLMESKPADPNEPSSGVFNFVE
jgi:hypothetical protein